jgi:hypothetical protein
VTNAQRRVSIVCTATGPDTYRDSIANLHHANVSGTQSRCPENRASVQTCYGIVGKTALSAFGKVDKHRHHEKKVLNTVQDTAMRRTLMKDKG